MANKALLQDIYLFSDMSDPELEIISDVAEEVEYQTGQDVFGQNEVATAFYIIREGSIRIHQKSSNGDNIEVAVLGTGSHFGEMPMIDGEKRSATATSIENCKALQLSYEKMESTLQSHPKTAVKFFRALSHFLCGRLRITTNDLSFARERNLRYF